MAALVTLLFLTAPAVSTPQAPAEEAIDRPAPPSMLDEGGPEVFFSDPFDDLDAWSFGGDAPEHWQVSDARAYEGTSLYYGDDGHFPDCGSSCRTWASSTPFQIPNGTDAFLYLWSHLDIKEGGFLDGFEIWADIDLGGGLRALKDLGDVRTVLGGFQKFNLSAAAGHELYLIFHLQQEHPSGSGEGAYLDHLIVTDLEVDVANEIAASGSEAATDYTFDVPAGGATATIYALHRGTYADGAALYGTVHRDGDLVYSAVATRYAPHARVELNLLGEEAVLFEYARPPAFGEAEVVLKIRLHDATAGSYQMTLTSAGYDDQETTSWLHTNTALGDVRADHGGEELALAFARDLDIQGAYVNTDGRIVTLIDGSLQVTAPGRAFAAFDPWVARWDGSLETPDGAADPQGRYHTAESGGTWTFQVDHAFDGYDIPWIALVGLPEPSAPVDLPGGEVDDLPAVGPDA